MRRRALLALAGCALAALLLAVLLRDGDIDTLARAWRALPPSLWALASAGLVASYLLRALRLHCEWGPRAAAGWCDCLRLLLVHNAAVNLLPLRSGEASYALLIRSRFGVPLAEAVASLLRLRAQDAVVLAAFAVFWLLPLRPALAGALALGLVALAALSAPSLALALRRVRLPVFDRAGPIAGDFASTRRLAGWAYAGANWCLKLLVLGTLLAALAQGPVAAGVRGALGGELGALLPLAAPAALGTYEAGVWIAAALRGGFDLAQVGPAALAVHLFSLLVSTAAAALSPLLGAVAQPARER